MPSADDPFAIAAPAHRYLRAQVEEDLALKMVFIGGPRQVGKTSLARSLLPDPACELNYDVAAHRLALLRHELPATDFWFFDEIHKYRGWRNYLKGLFDQHGGRRRILVTGSARLDLYRFGGDSLQGRYFYLRLHPFSVAELGGQADVVPALLALGGFPEPFLSASERFARRWALAYRERLVREEISGLEQVSDLGRLELLAATLPERVGSPLSLNSLREDLQVSHQTVSRWADMLERVYGIFRLAPFGAPRLRAVKKERKHYHYDWSVVPDAGARFENMVASHLLKWVEFQIDTEGRDLELRYFRDIDGREVDFLITERRQPIAMVECKLGDDVVSPGLRYLKARFPDVIAWQVSAHGVRDYLSVEGVRVAPAVRLLRELV
ncbi:ATP-binding protein [Aquincola sp. S2]|uniref:ATP-binding protein n=1 Tax=Pseudaquabacterium terrae TaxID=2732868 RepID=A0ABX2EEE1_9BURK|nr:ATP-binding protein [Aquabacterium terrae]NRF66992.1 ATP-binding protein [Aquabacterium terrae]